MGVNYLKQVSTSSEDWLQSLAAPLRPHLGKVGRFLLVATFLEDSLRIGMQWNEQVSYMSYARGFPWVISVCFLASVVLAMTVFSILVLFSRRYLNLASFGLMSVVMAQAIAYGLFTDLSFILRNLSLVGGLILLMAQNASVESKRNSIFGGIPIGPDPRTTAYLPLFGRVLLILLFLSVLLAGELTPVRALFGVVALISCSMIVVGFKAKTSAALLLALLSISNILLNNWWSLHANHPQRDFIKYDFFQTLSIMGGFLLLIQIGPGHLSVDEKKKPF